MDQRCSQGSHIKFFNDYLQWDVFSRGLDKLSVFWHPEREKLGMGDRVGMASPLGLGKVVTRTSFTHFWFFSGIPIE